MLPPCFPYFGGKNRVAAEVASLLPPPAPGLVHAEPFAGGLSVLFAKRPASATVNDKFGLLANFWSVLATEGDAYDEWYAQTVPMEALHREFRAASPATQLGRFQLATYFYWQLNLGFSGKWGAPFDRFSNATAFSTRPRHVKPSFLPWVQALRACHAVVTDRDFRDFFRVFRESTTRDRRYYYVDPPYYEIRTGYGGGEFAPQDHQDLRDLLGGTEDLWVLSYNDHPAVRALYAGFHVREIQLRYTTDGQNGVDETGHHELATELLISNQPFRVRDRGLGGGLDGWVARP